MYKKWAKTPEPLVLRSEVNPKAEAIGESSQQASASQSIPSTSTFLLPPNRIQNTPSRRDSSESDGQWAYTAAPTEYGDLHSAVPFHSSTSAVTPALPSALFPTSAQGYSTPTQGYSTPTEINSPPATEDDGINSYYYGSQGSRSSSESTLQRSDSVVTYQLATAVALNRANSNVSYNSIWSGDGSEQHLSLDINQFPQPPADSGSAGSSSRFLSNPSRIYTRNQTLPSPLYEESEPSPSRPLSPATAESHSQTPMNYQQMPTENDGPKTGRSTTKSFLVPPSPDRISSRASYQSHATAASRGSSIVPFTVEGHSRRQSETDGNTAWEDIMKAIKPAAVPTSVTSGTSGRAVVGANTLDSGESAMASKDHLTVGLNYLSPSAASSSDVYSAIGRMSFPNPPADPYAKEEIPAVPSTSQVPTPGTPRSTSTWITGVTLKTKSQSLSRPGSLASTRRRMEDYPGSPKSTAPPLPTGAKEFSSAIVVTSPSIRGKPIGGESFWGSSDDRSPSQRSGLELPTESRRSSSSGAPSYDRRVSELVKATSSIPLVSIDPVPSPSIASDSARLSVEDAVVGVARSASLSYTRVVSMADEQLTEPSPSNRYLVPSPVPTNTSEEIISSPEILTAVAAPPRSRASYVAPPVMLKLSSSLRRPPPIKGPGFFPESINSADQIRVYGDAFNTQDYSVPNSAAPLNKSFAQSTAPSSFRPNGVPIPNSQRNSDRPPSSRSKRSDRRNSTSSNFSHISKVVSRMSLGRATKYFSWLRRKPLPPPPAMYPWETREKALPNPEDDLSIPELATRAIHVHQYLDIGELPYTSPVPSPHGYVHRSAVARSKSIRSIFSSLSDRGENRRGSARLGEPHDQPSTTPMQAILHSRKTKKILIFVVVWVLVVVAIIVGVILGRRAQNRSARVCTSPMVGASCEMNSTCICTSAIEGRCDPVAKSLIDLIVPTNEYFGINITAGSLGLKLLDLKGDTQGDCSSQAKLVDVAPALSTLSFPRRTEWGRAALLYTLLQTEDLDALEKFRSAVAGSDFRSLSQDTPVVGPSRMTIQSSGFLFNFAAMNFAPVAISWKDNSQASATQISRVGDAAGNALDRMYSFATAASTQRSTSLMRYWTNDLQLPTNSLPKFLGALRDAPVLLPFDALSSPISNFLNSTLTSDSVSFPPPLACLTSVTGVDRTNLDVIEQNVFDLPSTQATPSVLDGNCFPNRPVYGVLDPLRLLQPFPDSRVGFKVPASRLIADSTSRVVVRSGERLISLAGSPSDAQRITLTPALADPREYGTLQHLNHVALDYLQSFPTTQLASIAAQFIISNTGDKSRPPVRGDPLFDGTDALRDIPIMEVSVFGSILRSDAGTYVSNMADSNGALFFGSNNGQLLRTWAIRDTSNAIVWSNSSSATTSVQEGQRTDAFETVWTLAKNLIDVAAGVNRGTGLPEVNEVMAALQQAGLLT